MGRKPGHIELTPEDHKYLKQLQDTSQSYEKMARRAKVLTMRADGVAMSKIASEVNLNINSVRSYIDKFLSGGIANALFDASGRGRKKEITDKEKAWVIDTFRHNPADFEYPFERWTYKKLAFHIGRTAESSGYAGLSRISESTVRSIIKEAQPYIRQDKLPNDLEEHTVLPVFIVFSAQLDENKNIYHGERGGIHILSYNEMPDIPAITTDTEGIVSKGNNVYLSLLSGIDLQTGNIIPYVSETHNINDSAEFLKKIDDCYPEKDSIALMTDNLEAFFPREFQKYTGYSGRIKLILRRPYDEYNCLQNIIESYYYKILMQTFCKIKAKSKKVLEKRIYQAIDELNHISLVSNWSYDPEEGKKRGSAEYHNYLKGKYPEAFTKKC
ncbi:MAG: helix-turn-helix domain-containing protein [Clostridiales bacterium]|nr:helix-turn-helix domain-containing protein [Clostridiales bacterium]